MTWLVLWVCNGLSSSQGFPWGGEPSVAIWTVWCHDAVPIEAAPVELCIGTEGLLDFGFGS